MSRMTINNAGGKSFSIDKWKMLSRFLIIGSDSPTYYVSAKDLTISNLRNLQSCLEEDPFRVINEVVRVSTEGRAFKNEPAIAALALASASSNTEARKMAFSNLQKVARTPTHLISFIQYRKQIAGWGRSMREAVRNWFTNKPVDKLAYHAVKYKNRNGWSQGDILRLARPRPINSEMDSVFHYMINGVTKDKKIPILEAAHELKTVKDPDVAASIISEQGIPWEAVPTNLMRDPTVWTALLRDMPMMATLRNLGRMGNLGMLTGGTEASKIIENRFSDISYVKASKVHPMAVLNASKVYGMGRGVKGNLSWPVSKDILDSLNDMFLASFQNVEPSGKRFIFGVDVSGSMGQEFAGSPLTCSEAAAAMAMIMVRTEPKSITFGFDKGFKDLRITENDSLQTVMKKCRPYNYGGTDCSLPMTWALNNKVENDVFVVLTDNETYSTITPSRAINRYRSEMQNDAKLAVVGMTSTGLSIADPNDEGMLDVVGMDTSVPKLVADFARGFEINVVPRIV